jgi:hypothetical protein
MENKLTAEQIGMEKISPSALMCYEECPLLFYYKYWLGLKISDTNQRHLKFGTAYHAAIENIYNQFDDNFKAGWEYSEVSIAIEEFEQHFKLKDISDEEFQRVLLMKSNKFSTKEELYESMLEDGKSMIRHYWKNKEYLMSEFEINIHESEIPMKVRMINPANPNESLPIPLSLRLDARTKGKEIIVEQKTSSSKYDEDETRKKLQGRCYAYAHWLTEKVIPKNVTYIINLKNKAEGKNELQVIVLKFDESDLQELYHYIESILQKIANREFGRGNVSGFNKIELDMYEKALGITN